ncbi:uncharacterized protein GGS22DRAFT_10146 [Annulohypoxylon maeteangense]|uniref:uncharacterized protein n=1 Tax=Annulohypoxylon maeteangense TaxID=1927788 RepID=UPI002008B3E5|nr:uncharacterized protein GGS22DRAFT_10146 [Annulohypoxylon maeteangense]KAI0890226.1 hypothetical protein GGS22DRAFT_10146 [Annulohypoxylon maeteangense]
MAIAPWGIPPREQSYMPHTSSPLNPSNPKASLRRQKRDEQSRTVKHEQSPTQRLMRQKAARAWRTMSSRDSTSASHARTTHNDGDNMISREQINGSHPGHSRTEYLPESKYQDDIPSIRQIDMEKQAFADGRYREEWPPERNYPFHSSTTKRLIIIMAILCIVGTVSALRIVAIGRIQAWRT